MFAPVRFGERWMLDGGLVNPVPVSAARALGQALVVAVNSDASVSRNKGPSRPIIPQAERAELLAALSCVDAVTVFDEDTPHAIIECLQPDILVD